MAAQITMNKKFSKDIAIAASLPTPALAKKKTVAASLKPKPPIDMGNRVIAPIIGIKIKKKRMFILIPTERAMI